VHPLRPQKFMNKILIATKNPGKAKEFKHLLGMSYEVLTLLDIHFPHEIVEDGVTFEENAKIKAMTIAKNFDGLVLADDSGLEVTALGGAPGVYSARYAGEPRDDLKNNQKLMEAMKAHEDRRARFRCTLVLAEGEQVLGVFEGECCGKILHEPVGDHGFGYDSLFWADGADHPFGKLSLDEKNKYSHRAKAMIKLREYLIG
ncbi:MAG: RdgB/HAM1 family non-canonical purine NTP pyrophosphatase, partial [Verrucomicrobiota bacterium]